MTNNEDILLLVIGLLLLTCMVLLFLIMSLRIDRRQLERIIEYFLDGHLKLMRGTDGIVDVYEQRSSEHYFGKLLDLVTEHTSNVLMYMKFEGFMNRSIKKEASNGETEE